MMGCSGARMLECLDAGVFECWGAGMLGCSGAGVFRYLDVGVLYTWVLSCLSAGICFVMFLVGYIWGEGVNQS